MLAAGDIDYMDPGAAYYQFTYMVDFGHAAAALGWQPDDVDEPTPDLADERAGDLRRRQDDHVHDPATGSGTARPVDREVTVGRRQVRDRARAAAGRRRTATRRPTSATSWASRRPQAAVEKDETARRTSAASRPRTTRRSSSSSTKPIGRRVCQSALAAGQRAGAGGVREGVRRGEPLDLRRARGRSRARTWSRTTPTGELTGYTPGKEIKLVRNPNWDPDTDWRPAYLDKITSRRDSPTRPRRRRRSSTASASGERRLPALADGRQGGRPGDKYDPSQMTADAVAAATATSR